MNKEVQKTIRMGFVCATIIFVTLILTAGVVLINMQPSGAWGWLKLAGTILAPSGLGMWMLNRFGRRVDSQTKKIEETVAQVDAIPAKEPS